MNYALHVLERAGNPRRVADIADNEFEVKHMPNAKLQVIDTDWGHFAGGPGTSPADIKVLDDALKELLVS